MSSQKKAVVAIGGNSLVKDKAHQSIQDQYKAVTETTKHITGMIEQGWTVAIAHGNGPQVGFVLRRSEVAFKTEGVPEVPLEYCGADTQGATGYMLQQNLYNEFLARGIDKNVATVVTMHQDHATQGHLGRSPLGRTGGRELLASRALFAGARLRQQLPHRNVLAGLPARLGTGAPTAGLGV